MIVFLLCWMLAIISFSVLFVLNSFILIMSAIFSDSGMNDWVGGTPVDHYKAIRRWFTKVWTSFKDHISNEIKNRK